MLFKKENDSKISMSDKRESSVKKFLNLDGLSHLVSLITSFVVNYASPKNHNHDGVYAKTAHTHSTDNITSGVLPIGRGGTGGTSAKAAQYNMFKDIDETTSTILNDTTPIVFKTSEASATNGALRTITGSKIWTWIKSKTDPLYQPKGSYATSGHTHTIANITNLQSQLDNKQPKGSYAAASHTHTIANITNLQSSLDGKAASNHNHSGVYAPVSHNHDAGNITSGTLPIVRGGTGATSRTAAVNSLGVYSLYDKTGIPANSDLNTYKTAGTYVIGTDANAKTLKNSPTGGLSFTLWVDYILGSNMYIVQKIQTYTNGVMYHRESTDSGQTWTAWKMVLDSNTYNSYAPTKTGGGASGTWGINISGTAAAANSVAWSNVSGKPSAFTPSSHTHTIANVSGLQTALDGKAASSHTHTIANITNLQSTLDSKQPKGNYAASGHTHDFNDVSGVLSVAKGGTGQDLSNGKGGVPYVFKGQPMFADAAPSSNNTFLVNNMGTLSFTSIEPHTIGAAGAYHKHMADEITNLIEYLRSNVFKVGYVWISYTSTSPASIIGGSWTAITGRFPYFNAGTGTGGSNSHTLSVNEMPNHEHPLAALSGSNDGGVSVPIAEHKVFMFSKDYNIYIAGQSKGGGAAHNNMPSYQTLYAWRRTG